MTSAWRMEATRRIAYEVAIVDGLLAGDSVRLAAAAHFGGGPSRRLVVTDPTVWSLYGEAFSAYASGHGAELEVCLLDPGEDEKSLEQVVDIIAACDGARLLRQQTPIVALGGGTVLDLTGLAASLYRRGVPHVRVPTTLIGMIDAGVGAKTAVNHLGRKSLLGTYHPPVAVLGDPVFLHSLDRREIVAGLAEATKIALVRDAELFGLIEREAEVLAGDFLAAQSWRSVMGRSIEAMLAELGGNLWEERLDRPADFGHTFSPGVEMAALPRLTHGEAVALDIAVSCMLAVNRGLLGEEDGQRVLRTLRVLGLPIEDEAMTTERLAMALESTVRHRDGLQRAPLLSGIGSVTFVNDISTVELGAALEALASAAPLAR